MLKTVGENEEFVSLILAARQDSELRNRLVSILSLASFHRRSLLNTFLHELRMKQAPDSLVNAITCLLDDAVAAEALAAIQREHGASR